MANGINRRSALAAVAGLAAGAFATRASAQPYPSRPVKLVVGSPPGGPSDFLARIYGDNLGPQLGQNFVVENKAGASGTLAADGAAKAAADGHTLLVSGPASIVAVPHIQKVNYEPMADFVPVSMLGAGAFAFVVHPSLPVKNVQELVAYLKANPGKVAYGSGGNGSSGHLCTEYFCQTTGTKMTHVPYKGDGQALNDLLANQFQVMFTAPNVAMPHVKAGKLRLLAVTTRDRVASMPEVPTVHEQGVKDFEYLGWIIVFAPAATPKPALDALAAAWNKSRGTPAVRGKLEELAMVAPERFAQPGVLAQFVKAESARLGKLIRDNNIKAE